METNDNTIKKLKEITFRVVPPYKEWGAEATGKINVDVSKSDAVRVLGRSFGTNESLTLSIPEDLQEDFITLWEKVKNRL